MAERTSKAILAKGIRLDRNYKNILDYSESSMLSLVQSKSVASNLNCSFLRDEGVLQLDIPYGTALTADYMAFQNPAYSNKWFFAFIDKVEYYGEKNTRIYYTIDVCSTWFDYWTPQKCWVIREHANTDVAGDNLVPENLELGEFVANGARVQLTGNNFYRYALISTAKPNATTKYVYTNLCGVICSGQLFVFKYAAQFANFVLEMSNAGKLDAISQAYMIPDSCLNFDQDLTLRTDLAPNSEEEKLYYTYNGSSSPYQDDVTISRPNSLNGYTPVNKKLLTAPFCSIVVSNNAGSATNYAYEFFSNPTACKFRNRYMPVVGASIITFPCDYKGVTYNFNELITGAKYPALQWTGDTYTNWLTQNAVNIGLGVVSDGIGLAKSAIALDAGDVKSAAAGVESVGVSIVNQMSELYKHSLVPMTIRGASNIGDVMTGMKELQTYAYRMSITAQFAERIDQFFTRYGYATNKLKLPNQIGRATFNYVQIAAGEDIGHSGNTISVPPADMEIINNAYRSGVTIWHNHDNIGNFNLANGIVS